MPVTIRTGGMKYKDPTSGQYTGIDAIGIPMSDIVATNYTDLVFPVSIGQHCIYNEKYYIANTDIAESEEWTAAHWTEVTIDDEISGKADKTDTVLNTTLSRGRKANTTVGTASFAFGNDIEVSGAYSASFGYENTVSADHAFASGDFNQVTGEAAHVEGDCNIASGYAAHAEGCVTVASNDFAHAEGCETQANGETSHAEGDSTIADAYVSHAEGLYTIAAGSVSHVSGSYNVADSYDGWSEWVSGTSYSVGDKVKRTITSNDTTTVNGYICKTANSDTSFTSSKWIYQLGIMNYTEIVGNGTDDNARSNARVLDWNGNERLKGDLYVGCNADSTGGNKVATQSELSVVPVFSVDITTNPPALACDMTFQQVYDAVENGKCSECIVDILGTKAYLVVLDSSQASVRFSSTSELSGGTDGMASNIVTYASDGTATMSMNELPFYINLAKQYNQTSGLFPVTTGDYCINNAKLYKAKVDIASYEAFNSSKWEQVTVGAELNTKADKNALTVVPVFTIGSTNSCDMTFADVVEAVQAHKCNGCICLNGFIPLFDYIHYGNDNYLLFVSVEANASGGFIHHRTIKYHSDGTIEYNEDAMYDGANLAPPYEYITFPVAEGTLCYERGVLWKANQDIPTQEEFDYYHWDMVSVAAELNRRPTDVQVNGTSVVTDGIANVPVASSNEAGVVKVKAANGLQIKNTDEIYVTTANSAHIKSNANVSTSCLTPAHVTTAVFYGLSNVAGDITQRTSANALGIYTPEAKAAIWNMLGLDGSAFVKSDWELIREDTVTNATEADIEISVDGNGNAFELTDVYLQVWTPQQETGASIGDYGTVRNYYSNSEFITSQMQTWEQASGASAKYGQVLLKNENGAVINVVTLNNSQYALVGLTGRTNMIANDALVKIGQYTFKKTVIKKVTGTIYYRLYGKRKRTALDSPVVNVSGTTPSITALPGHRYICGEVSTLIINVPASGCIDVVFESGSTATVLTVTPTKTGVTAIKWAGSFDPTSLDANTRYEILIDDGEWGMVASWT